MDYYIDGTINSIELAMEGDLALHFTLLPSPEFLKTVAEGKKKALFIGTRELHQPSKQNEEDKMLRAKQTDEQKNDKQEPMQALLVNVAKNESGKEILRFEMPKTCIIFRGMLLEAKNSRNAVRVLAKSKGVVPEELRIDFDKPVSITIL